MKANLEMEGPGRLGEGGTYGFYSYNNFFIEWYVRKTATIGIFVDCLYPLKVIGTVWHTTSAHVLLYGWCKEDLLERVTEVEFYWKSVE